MPDDFRGADAATRLDVPTSEDPLRDLLAFHKRIRLALTTFDEIADAPDSTVDRLAARALVDFFERRLAWHDTDEETSLLPRLRQAGKDDEAVLTAIKRCTRQHNDLEDAIDDALPRLRAIAKGTGAPDGELVRDDATKLRSILEPHLKLEEREIFPAARRLLTSADLNAMRAELKNREEERRRGEKRAVRIATNPKATTIRGHTSASDELTEPLERDSD